MQSPSTRFVRRFLPMLALAFFCGITLTGQRLTLLPLAEFEPEAEAHEAKPGAEEWFYEQRAYPLKAIPAGARLRAFEQAEREERRLRPGRRAVLQGEGESGVLAEPAWQPLGPAPILNGSTLAAGRMTAVALEPDYDGVNNRTLYAGAAHGGLWRSTDNGANWTPLFDEQASQAIGSIVIEPNNPQVIYVGTGTATRSISSYYGAGLLKSVDGGASWRRITGPISTRAPLQPAFIMASIPRIVLDPNNTSTIYLCTVNGSITSATGSSGSVPLGQRGVWKSTDAGETWRNLDPLNNGGATNANDLVLDPKTAGFVLTALQANGLFRSTANGEPGTWERLSGLPNAGTFGRVALAPGPPLAPATNTTFYALFALNANPQIALYRSTDNGTTWQQLTVPTDVAQPFHNLVLTVDPQDANLVYLGEVQLHRSTDGGQTWARITTGDGSGALHVDQQAFVINPRNRNQIVLGNDGGVWRSENATASAMRWENLNRTLNTVQFQGLALHPADPNFLLGGTQDNGSLRFTGTPAWAAVAGGDGGAALIDQSNPTTVYHNFQSSTGSYGPRVSFNSGTNWTDIGCRSCTATPGRLHPSDRVNFYAPFAAHTGFNTPPNGNVIYYGTQRVYRSADNGRTWTGLGPSADGFGQDLSRGTSTVSAIAAHPTLDNAVAPPGEIVWVGTTDGLIRVATDAGKLAEAVFTNVTKAPLPNRFVTDFALDPADTRRAFASYSGFDLSTPTTLGHVFVTEDRGETWRNVSGNLPDVPVLALALDPQLPGTIYAGTDLGVFRTVDGGATWLRFGTGIPNTSVFILRYHAATRSLVAATHGRGAFRLNLPRALVTVSAASFTRTALAVEGIVAAFGSRLATGSAAANSIPLPTELAGTRVLVRDANGVERPAPLFFVSPEQINYQIPADTAPGLVEVTVLSSDGTISGAGEAVRNVAPTLFTANSNGRGVPAGYGVRVRGGEQTVIQLAALVPTATPPLQPAELDLGPEGDQVVLVLFGTGLRRRPDLSGVDVSIGGVKVPAQYAGEVAGLVGLDQLNFGVPRSLIGRGEVDVVVNASGVAGNTVRVRIK